MTEAATAGAMPLLPGLPDEIVIWEVLVRLPPICLLRCRAVGRSWRRFTSTRNFLLAHHGRQPSLPIVSGFNARYHNILTFEHRQAADVHLQPVAPLDQKKGVYVDASCEGLLILSIGNSMHGDRFFVCNPATRQHAPLSGPPDFRLFTFLGIYPHRPTDEYRLLMYRRSNEELIDGNLLPKGRVGCYIFTLGSDKPRYIGGPEEVSALLLDKPALVRESLHWSPVQHQSEGSLLLVFDTTSESFRHICAPNVPTGSYIFEMDGTLGINSYNDDTQIVDIWVLQNYEGDVWEYKYRVKLPEDEIRGLLGGKEDELYVDVVSSDGDVLLLIGHERWLFYVDTDGKLVDSFLYDGQEVYACQSSLKQTLVQHNFFKTLEGYALIALDS